MLPNSKLLNSKLLNGKLDKNKLKAVLDFVKPIVTSVNFWA